MQDTDTGTLWTIGHSVRPWPEFKGMLAAARIDVLADVRRFAGSRRHPQFGADVMAASLMRESIEYVAMPALGGRRTPVPDSPNIAWRSAGFRGYADYMATPAYHAAISRLARLALQKRVVVMCAEALWWQCHRSLIADDFKARGWEVMHLLSSERSELHPYTAAARIVQGRLDYSLPADPQTTLF